MDTRLIVLGVFASTTTTALLAWLLYRMGVNGPLKRVNIPMYPRVWTGREWQYLCFNRHLYQTGKLNEYQVEERAC